jgi:cyanophycinase
MGHILLEGGAEFGGRMVVPDRHAIRLAGGPDASISIIPAAAAPDNNHRQAGERAEAWFRKLGARQVQVLPLTDPTSARKTAVSEALRNSSLIYILGGFPVYLADTLRGSPSWQAITQAVDNGGVLAGSSAGAMVLCEHYFDPSEKAIKPGLNLIRNACVVPHHDTFGAGWIQHIEQEIPQAVLIGIDEETGMIREANQGAWQVYGGGDVSIYRRGGMETFSPGQRLALR